MFDKEKDEKVITQINAIEDSIASLADSVNKIKDDIHKSKEERDALQKDRKKIEELRDSESIPLIKKLFEKSIKNLDKRINKGTMVAIYFALFQIVFGVLMAVHSNISTAKELDDIQKDISRIETMSSKVETLLQGEIDDTLNILKHLDSDKSLHNNYKTKSDLKNAYLFSLIPYIGETRYQNIISALKTLNLQKEILPTPLDLQKYDKEMIELCSNAVQELRIKTETKNNKDSNPSENECEYSTYAREESKESMKDWGWCENETTYDSLIKQYKKELEKFQKQLQFNNSKKKKQ